MLASLLLHLSWILKPGTGLIRSLPCRSSLPWCPGALVGQGPGTGLCLAFPAKLAAPELFEGHNFGETKWTFKQMNANPPQPQRCSPRGQAARAFWDAGYPCDVTQPEASH